MLDIGRGRLKIETQSSERSKFSWFILALCLLAERSVSIICSLQYSININTLGAGADPYPNSPHNGLVKPKNTVAS